MENINTNYNEPEIIHIFEECYINAYMSDSDMWCNILKLTRKIRKCHYISIDIYGVKLRLRIYNDGINWIIDLLFKNNKKQCYSRGVKIVESILNLKDKLKKDVKIFKEIKNK